MLRIRHCVECPKCFTRYIVSFSPYRNGSYLITTDGSSEEYALHCSCSRASAISRWREVKTCAVSKEAYDRGYGAPDEITPITNEQPGGCSVGPEYLDDWKPNEKRKNSL
jgi:hypothetical protein